MVLSCFWHCEKESTLTDPFLYQIVDLAMVWQ